MGDTPEGTQAREVVSDNGRIRRRSAKDRRDRSHPAITKLPSLLIFKLHSFLTISIEITSGTMTGNFQKVKLYLLQSQNR